MKPIVMAIAFSFLAACNHNDASRDGGADLSATNDLLTSPWKVEFADSMVKLSAIWGSGPNDIYAVGHNGNAAAIYHSTGDGNWVAQTTGVNGDLYCLWGS